MQTVLIGAGISCHGFTDFRKRCMKSGDVNLTQLPDLKLHQLLANDQFASGQFLACFEEQYLFRIAKC